MTTSQSRDSRGGGRPGTRRFSGRRRRQCVCKEVGTVDYKDVSVLRRFINDRGRIESGRKAGNCAKCQRELSTAIARARHLALLPFAPSHLRVTGSIAPATPPAESADGEADESDSADESSDTSASVEPSEEEQTDGADGAEESAESESQPEANEESSDDSDDDAPAKESEDEEEKG